MIRPMRAGTATASAVRISGAERCSVFCIENAVPKPPRSTSSKNSTGDLPSASRNSENSSAGDHEREQRNGDVFRAAAGCGPTGRWAPSRRLTSRRAERFGDIGHGPLYSGSDVGTAMRTPHAPIGATLRTTLR